MIAAGTFVFSSIYAYNGHPRCFPFLFHVSFVASESTGLQYRFAVLVQNGSARLFSVSLYKRCCFTELSGGWRLRVEIYLPPFVENSGITTVYSFRVSFRAHSNPTTEPISLLVCGHFIGACYIVLRYLTEKCKFPLGVNRQSRIDEGKAFFTGCDGLLRAFVQLSVIAKSCNERCPSRVLAGVVYIGVETLELRVTHG